MKMTVRLIAQGSYVVAAAVMVVLGAGVLLAGAGVFPSLQNSLVEEAQGSLDTVHILQEFASVLIFAGLVTLWFVRHYDQSMAFHWLMTLFLGLIAVVHWFDVRGPSDSIAGGIVIGVPFIWFAVVGVLRTFTDRGV
jgi:hypothetical protein